MIQEEMLNEFEAADRFWAEAKARVERLAAANGIRATLSEHDDGFLYDVFDCGDYDPTDDEIVEALRECFEEAEA